MAWPQSYPGLYEQLLGIHGQQLGNEQQGIMNKLQGAKVPFAPQMAQEDLMRMQIANQYMPQEHESRIAHRRAQTKDIPMRTGIAQQDLMLRQLMNNPEMLQARMEDMQSRTAMNKLRAQYMPQQEARNERRYSPSQLAALEAERNNRAMYYGKDPLTKIAISQGLNEAGLPPGSPYTDMYVDWANKKLGKAPTQSPQQMMMQQPNAQQDMPQQTPAQQGLMPEGPMEEGVVKPLPKTSFQNELSGQYDLARQKAVTDPWVRRRNEFGTNIEKTFDFINKDFAQYAGPGGKALYAKDATAAASGKAPQRFTDYKIFVDTQRPILASQIRQFYGDSITPVAHKRIEDTIYSNDWISNPEIALQKFNGLKKILDAELETYREAMGSTKPYQKHVPTQQSATSQVTADQARAELERRRGSQ